eukprot:gene10914-7996_t
MARRGWTVRNDDGNDNEGGARPRHPAHPPPAPHATIPVLTPKPYLGLVPPSQLHTTVRNDNSGFHPMQPGVPVAAPIVTPKPYLGL